MEVRGQPQVLVSGAVYFGFWDRVSRWDLELTSQAKLTGQQASGIPLSASLASGLWVCTMPGFLCECWGLNSGPCIRTTSILQTELSSLPAGTVVECLPLSVWGWWPVLSVVLWAWQELLVFANSRYIMKSECHLLSETLVHLPLNWSSSH